MSETKSMRVVPSGKIYRQMFEAQVQLNRSLTKIQRDSTSGTKSSQLGTNIPLVRLSKDDIEHGILGKRQQTWADGFPNDPYTENPVAYKQYAEYVGSQMKEHTGSVEGKEVRGLPDVVVSAKEKSNIIERISASRKERHEATVEEMHQELSLINSDMEPRISEACTNLLQKLDDDNADISKKLARIEKDEDLLSYSMEGLQELMWADIMSHSEVRRGWITDLDATLKKAEDNRMQMIRQIFKDYAKTLEKIAYILSPDLHRFMDKESQLINQTVLSNRRAYGDLYVRLMSSDIEREKSQHTLWKRRVDDWKMLKTELAIERFKTFMSDEKVVSPEAVKTQLQYMLKEQELLNHKRLELVNQLRDLMPPSSTKTSVYHWNKGVQDVTKEIDTTNQLHLQAIHKEYENVCQTCLDEIEKIKAELIATGVCTQSRAKTVVEEFMIPLVGDRQRIYEQNLETMEKNLEAQNKQMTEQLKSLFKFAQGAAHVWDVHEIGLARQERALQEKLEQCRQQHDNQNQEKEAHLDIIMDRMRQDASEKTLKDSLGRALEMLEKIRHAYEVFHKDQTTIVKQYPDMVKTELDNYDEALCTLFQVNRNNPQGIDDETSDADDVDEEGVLCVCAVSLDTSRVNRAPDGFDSDSYLETFGYLDEIADGKQHDEASRANAISEFQEMAGITVTGIMNDETLEKMLAPRCGVPDVVRPSERLSSINARKLNRKQPLEFNAPGLKWKKNDLTYKFTSYSRQRQMPQSSQRRALRNAFSKWAEVTPLTFRETRGDADILLDFVWRDHRDGSPFDGRGGTLAHAFFPGDGIGGDTHFDEEEQWTENTKDGTNLEIVAAHELGHALGLSHSMTSGALMQPFYSYSPKLQLHSDDIRGIQSLYGGPRRTTRAPRTTRRPRTTRAPRTTRRPRTTRAPRTTRRPRTTPKTPDEDVCQLKFDDIANGPDGRLYAFRYRKIYKFNSDGVGIERKFPRNVRKIFPRAPNNIGAAVYNSRQNKFYIFKGSKLWRYTGFELDSGYPTRLRGWYRGVQAALIEDNGEIRVLKGSEMSPWREDFREPPRGYPIAISRRWNGLRSDLEAAVRYRRTSFFFKGGNYFKWSDYSRSVEYRRAKAGPWMGCGTPGPK